MSGARVAAPTPVDGFMTVGEIIAKIGDEFRPENRVRFLVARTKLTAERQPIPRGLRILIYKRDNFCCQWCGSSQRLVLDHIMPWSAGGEDTFDNLRTLCWDCNEYRSNTGRAVDLMCRQLPAGGACVNCLPEISGNSALCPVFCLYCEEKTCGLTISSIALAAWEDEEIA